MAAADRRTAMVTGANGAIGKAIALAIASDPGYRVVLLCRDEKRAVAAAQEVRARSGNREVTHALADLSRHASIRELAKTWRSALHVLVNNAAVTPRRREETPEGIERQFATNVLGYYWMMGAFSKHLLSSAPARVVNVASYWAGGLDLSDLEFRRRGYDNDRAYRQSKQADRMLSAAFAQRWQGTNISVNACHPGDVNSTLSNNLGFGGHQSPEQGAATPAWLATSKQAATVSGGYFEDRRQVRCPFAADEREVGALVECCSRY